MMTPQERYESDAHFKRLVDTIHCLIREAQYTPSEIRDAAMLATIHHESLTIRPKFVFNDELR